ncbi:CTLH/CRA C-terminal to lish motif domain-containing protein [Multifurca ochricompacta]|uniref:CTLH/CRA C-terminal to lish motif domain-containing protein n=1 Tax=Multifurca ochricompacta TaxID=376703 RepID=A0AAD4QRQ5_9AGAM|nr:CTLH/CRA C-terminal to lish motif domain-containing protein [Multifurca ochricompacta]
MSSSSSHIYTPTPPLTHRNWQVNTYLFHLYQSFISQKRALILDYLVQRCYTRTARAFAADSTIRHLDADGDEIRRPHGEDDALGITEEVLHQADLRRDVQTGILSGRIDDTINLLNDNFPSILSSSASTSAGTESTTHKVEHSQSRRVRTVLPFTVEPAHLYLDLRILAFIEASRTKPLPYSLSRPPTSDPELIPRISPSSNFRDPSGEADGDAHLARLLKHVYELYDCAQALQDPHERAEYQHELSAVSSLLAYKVPEQSPMAKYLAQERRQLVADEINSAILYRAGCHPISYLELCVRYNTAIWNYMNEHDFRVPHSRGWPAGIVLPSRSQPMPPSAPLAAKVSVSRQDDLEIVPTFDLSRFLSTST